MFKQDREFYDVAVIGGGPSGMMAAGRAGELGAKTALLEKNNSLGRKLLLTGKGRSNLTKAEFNARKLVKKYGKKGDFLLSPLSALSVEKTIDFFEKRGLKTKIERGKRIFPQSGKATDVLNILINYLKKNKVEIITNSGVKEIIKNGNRVTKVILNNGREIVAKNYIIATGGKSYPITGSTGDGYQWAKELGHTINKLRPALVPLKIKESWPKEAQGLSLKNIELSVFLKSSFYEVKTQMKMKENSEGGKLHRHGKKKDSRFGEMLFTHFGVSGPIALDLSYKVGELLDKGEVKLVLDLKPALDFETLDKRIQKDFAKYSNKLFRNSLSDLLPQKLIPIIVKLSGINSEKKVNEISRQDRQRLVKLLKGLEMTVFSLLGFETAIVTSGGIHLAEINAKTMKSKLIENLFFAGEIIDLHGPTGGYNLQLCWSTGFLAGQSAANVL